MLGTNAMEKRLQIAGVLLIVGLLIEAVCLSWAKPIAFVLFVAIGGAFLFAGLLFFLVSLVWHTPEVPSRRFE